VPALRARVAETEQLRQLPQETIDDVQRSGLFELMTPTKWGGQGGGLRDYVEVTKVLAEGDPSASWPLSFLMLHHWLLARFPVAAQEAMFADGPVALTAAVANPPGKAVEADGGYRLTGRWAYASAVMHADWLVAVGMTPTEAKPKWFLVPLTDVTVHDTWHTSGMRGTGSHDVSVDDLFVPSEMAIDFELWGSPDNPGVGLHEEPITGYDFRDVMGLIFPAILVGAARATLRDFGERLPVRKLAFASTPQVDSPTTRARYGRAAGEVRVAEILLDHATESIVARYASGGRFSDEERVLLKLELLNCAQTAHRAIATVIDGSGSSIFKTNNLAQHYQRDTDMIMGHFTFDADWVTEVAGTVLLGVGGIANPGHFF
jgi:alkylation response protein AidB-like acyl-CoA dehydrogenase